MELELEGFLQYMRDTKKMSDNTVVSYKRDLNKLLAYLREKGIRNFESVSTTHLESYILMIEQQGFASASVSRMVASVKALYKYLFKSGQVTRDVAEALRAPKVEKKQREQLSTEEVFRLLEQPPQDSDKGIRDRAMMELLYATGIRVSDLIALQVSDVNLKLGCVTCRSKTIPFGRETQVALARYISGARDSFVRKSKCELLFMNCSGSPMSRQGFWKLMKSYAKAAGIHKDITSNMIRKI